MEDEFREYYIPIDANQISASIKDVFRFIMSYDEYIAEFEGFRCYFEMYFVNNKIYIELYEEFYSNEYYGGHNDIETTSHKRIIATIPASATEYSDMLIDLIENRQLYDEIYGKRRVNSLHFTTTKYAQMVRKMIV